LTGGEGVTFDGDDELGEVATADVVRGAARADGEGSRSDAARRGRSCCSVMKAAAAPAFVRRALVRDLYVAPQVGMFSEPISRRGRTRSPPSYGSRRPRVQCGY
jgi:hypothetical protein